MPLIPMLLLAALAVYLLICLLALAGQHKMVFFPDRQMVGTPQDIGLEYSDVYFPAEDGVELHGWLIPAQNTDRELTLLFCHGNAGNISNRLDTIRIFHDLGLSVFIFDYRGYGQSKGRVSEKGTYRDAGGAWRYLVEKPGCASGNVIVAGRSLGGAVAIELAARCQPRGLIVESTFTSVPDLGARLYPWLPVRQFSRIHYDSAGRIRNIRCPKLFVHSLHDELIPYGLGLRLFVEASKPKQMLKIRGTHSDGFLTSGSRYLDGVTKFIDSLVE